MKKADKQGRSSVYVTRAEFSRIEVHCYSELSLEVGGFLIGDVVNGETEIVASIPALKANSQQISLTFTHEVWEDALQTVARDYPGHSIVGWYHTHPSFGLFLSEYDMFIQKNFFSAPGQVALVVDPIAGTFAWFAANGRSKEPKIVHQGTTTTGAKTRIAAPARTKSDAVRFVASLVATSTVASLVTWALTTTMMPEGDGDSNWKNRALMYQSDLQRAGEVFNDSIWVYQLGEGESLSGVITRLYGAPEVPETLISLNGWDSNSLPTLEEGDVFYLIDVPGLAFPGVTFSDIEEMLNEANPTPAPSTSPTPDRTPKPGKTSSGSDS